jgi:integrase
MIPKGVTAKHGRYYLVRRSGARTHWIGLTRIEEGPKALQEALAKIESPHEPRTVGELIHAFLEDKSLGLAPATHGEYLRCAHASLIPALGRVDIHKLRPSMVATYLERGRRAGRAVSANRERAVLSSAFEWGMRNGYAESNPCRGVRRNRESPSRVYVTDEQYLAAYRRAPQCVRNLMHVGYLTGLRLSDLCSLRQSWVTSDGIELTESKTGKRRLIEWSPFLRPTIARALEYAGASPYVLVAARGQPWQPWAVQSAWKRVGAGFPFRAIRAKAATDSQHNTLGHQGQMLARYVRRERLRPVA